MKMGSAMAMLYEYERARVVGRFPSRHADETQPLSPNSPCQGEATPSPKRDQASTLRALNALMIGFAFPSLLIQLPQDFQLNLVPCWALLVVGRLRFARNEGLQPMVTPPAK